MAPRFMGELILFLATMLFLYLYLLATVWAEVSRRQIQHIRYTIAVDSLTSFYFNLANERNVWASSISHVTIETIGFCQALLRSHEKDSCMRTGSQFACIMDNY